VQHIRNKDFKSLNESELAEALKSGEREAFAEIVRRFQGRVYAAAYRVTGNREDALDVAQESFIKVYRKINAWQPTGGFLAWVLRVTTNQAIDHVRHRKRMRQTFLDETLLNQSEGVPVEPSGFDTEQEVRSHEIEAHIREVLVLLSPMQRKVFVMRHFEGFPLADIAEDLKCTVGSVKVHLFRAMKKMRDELEKRKQDL